MAKRLLCPRDLSPARLERKQGRFGRFSIDVCPQCDGVWFDEGELTKITGSAEVEETVFDAAAGRSELRCPRCQGAMAGCPVAGVRLDVCTDCKGVWMDHGELETAVRNFARAPIPPKGLRFGRELRARDAAYEMWRSPDTVAAIRALPSKRLDLGRR